ncbi:Glucose-1-phosphate adenylyltransferase [Rhynchospora pubera]|uniref:glucose-1-phosphate adenylyltransferase n=1 Tax=Rhynchospora pubera TaxID=906938 RepID=A0AAV8AMB1_9POAL|nr:Glucose-1-phosphate adenylyltransferase [Rhynchospora pubera]
MAIASAKMPGMSSQAFISSFSGDRRSSLARSTVHCPRKGVRLRRSTTVRSILNDFTTNLEMNQVKKVTQPVDPQAVISIILGGGAGTRLFPLTQKRAKPAVPVGGCYRLIDIPVSNCINSGIKKIYILTQFNSQSLNRHIAHTYNFGNGLNFDNGFVEILAATQTPGEFGKRWFQGTADAVRQFIWMFEDFKMRGIENVLILSGDHLYRMDYMDFIQKHKESNADISVSCVTMDDSRASDFGLVKIDKEMRITRFLEKPKGDDLKRMQIKASVLRLLGEADPDKNQYIASMGIYVFKTDVLLKLLSFECPCANDFGSEVIPTAARKYKVQAYLFKDYWEDIGTIKSFFDANLALTDEVVDSIISDGSFLSECSVEHSIVGIRSRLQPGVELKDTMMMGADFYQTEEERADLLNMGQVPVGIGEKSKIRNCIIDKNARIGRNVVLMNTENVQEADKPELGFYIRSGITVVYKNSMIPDGTKI